ncbi:DNA repair exonuclease [Paracoccus gahaiensis]|uniref:DNA repair exonuclease n=1 Tax=Paracoccus gahaiensis TaxID=1706839 RepID=A0A4U0R7F2_9RHOB|nr:DNA repair exonuclease [Paracoccus gahaiensis]TJZ90929.1 DNA repair exonuclease [Paracoccus gahaiensis]
MTKILHTADIHLDSPLRSLALRNPELREAVVAATRASFTRLVDLAIAEDVAALLIAGDLFDGRERSARTGAFLMGELDRLGEAGIRVFYTKGNHDAENPITGTLDLPAHVHVFDARGGREHLRDDVWIHGVSFADRHAPDSLLPRFKAPVRNAVNIAMLHSSLGGAAGHDVYAPCTVADLAGLGFDYWALGHVHKRQIHSEAPWVVMPGIPQGRDIGEAGSKSVTLLTLDRGRIEVSERRTSVVDFVQSALDVTEADSDEALRLMLRQHLAGLRQDIAAPTGVIRLSLTGRPDRHWQILRDHDVWSEQADDLARAAGDLWIDKLLLDLAPPDAGTGAAGAADELAAMMTQIRSEPGFAATARDEVDAVLQDLPPGLRDRLMPGEAARDALADGLARAGANLVLARMKGAVG